MRYALRSSAVRAALAAVAFPAVASSLFAQAGAVDPLFQPWLGCWSPITDAGIPDARVKPPTQACVAPSSTRPGGIDFVLYNGATVISRVAVPQPGTTAAKRLDDCEGNETATWSADERRLLLRAELTCVRGVKRIESGLMAMTGGGEWLQIQHLDVDGNAATTVTRMRFRNDAGSAWHTLGGGASPSTESLRLAMGAPIGTAAVIDLAQRAPSALTEAWLVEVSPRFALDGKTLVQLSKAGLSPRVIDLMVAVSHPEAFSLNAQEIPDDFDASEAFDNAIGRSRRGAAVSDCGVADDFCYGPAGLGAWGLGWQNGAASRWSPWALQNRGFDFNSPNGLNAGFGWNAGLGNGYFGNSPIIIVNRPSNPSNEVSGEARARAIRGAGYARDRGAPSSGAPTARKGTPSGSAGAAPRGSSGGASGSASGGSSSGSDKGRSAKRRRPGGI